MRGRARGQMMGPEGAPDPQDPSVEGHRIVKARGEGGSEPQVPNGGEVVVGPVDPKIGTFVLHVSTLGRISIMTFINAQTGVTTMLT